MLNYHFILLGFKKMLSSLKTAEFKFSFLKEKNLFIEAFMTQALCINQLDRKKLYKNPLPVLTQLLIINGRNQGELNKNQNSSARPLPICLIHTHTTSYCNFFLHLPNTTFSNILSCFVGHVLILLSYLIFYIQTDT